MNRNRNNTNPFSPFAIGMVFFAIFLLVIGYWLRAWTPIHGTFMVFYQYPIMFWMPVIGLSFCGLLLFITGDTFWPGFLLTIGIILYIVLLFLIGPMNSAKMAKSLNYNEKMDIHKLEGGDVRVKPYEVAETQMNASFNSTTDELSDFHIVKQNGKLYWTALKQPKGTWRKLSKPSTGMVYTDAETSGGVVTTQGKTIDAEFKYAPGMHISQNTAWQIRKKFCYTCVLKEAVGISTPKGPIIMIPFDRLTGNMFSKYETFGGVFLVHPNGYIKEYSPSEAIKVPMIAQSGRMFPEKLARQYASVYKYKLGLLNRMFTHKEGYDVIDSGGSNSQPYLETFKGLKFPQWVTTMQPRGKSSSVGLILFVDSVTGTIREWRAPQGTSYVSNGKAINVLKGETINGINFAGAFRAIEPRQVFPHGEFSYLISIVPSAEGSDAIRVTRNVVVPALQGSTTPIRIFDATPEGDKELIAYLNGDIKDAGAEIGDEGTTTTTDSSGNVTTNTGSSKVITPKNEKQRQKIIKKLIEQNKYELEQLKALQNSK